MGGGGGATFHIEGKILMKKKKDFFSFHYLGRVQSFYHETAGEVIWREEKLQQNKKLCHCPLIGQILLNCKKYEAYKKFFKRKTLPRLVFALIFK